MASRTISKIVAKIKKAGICDVDCHYFSNVSHQSKPANFFLKLFLWLSTKKPSQKETALRLPAK
jgi:hypothetical protein